MPISKIEKKEVLTSVLIEMQRMFTVLSNDTKADQKEKRLLLEKIEAAFKSILTTIK